MADYKSKIIGYIEGKISPEEFFTYLEENPSLFDWLQSIVPEGKTTEEVREVEFDHFFHKLSEEEREKVYSAKNALFECENAEPKIQFDIAKEFLYLLYELNEEKEIFYGTVPQLISAHKNTLDKNETADLDFYSQFLPKVMRGICKLPTYERYQIPFNVKSIFENKSRTCLWYYVEVQSRLANLMKEIFPEENIILDETLHKKASFSDDVRPEYIGGGDLETEQAIGEIIDGIIASVPEDMPISKRKKLIKEKIKEAFPCKTKKYPHWVQSEEWQISESGKPMRFIEQKRKKGKEYKDTLHTEFYFEDVDTGEIRIVEQFT